ncbi:MAG: hypothetical protein EU531_00500 [Promethearchaeota archaeon]|nr:MAG: hypothetical protein EU531_00500 [Candidatus Lokiarchaeota archaeon]
MKPEEINKTLSLLSDLEEKRKEIHNLLAEMAVSPRLDLLEEIVKDVLDNNVPLQKMGYTEEKIKTTEKESEPQTIMNIINNLISNIKTNPSIKIIYIKLFLDRFHEISDQDKAAILQDVKDVDPDKLKDKLLPLVSVFELDK